MKVIPTELRGVLRVEGPLFTDDRGLFRETFNEARFALHADDGLPTHIRQINHSRSGRSVLRGLHFQLHRPQGKLITVIRGQIFDVAVDLRRDSSTFRRWTAMCLDGDEPAAIWIPPGYAHGFCVLSDVADVVYASTELYDAGDEYGIRWDDPDIRISWPTDAPRLSEKDATLPTLAEATRTFLRSMP